MYDNAMKCGNCQKYSMDTNDMAIGSVMNEDHTDNNSFERTGDAVVVVVVAIMRSVVDVTVVAVDDTMSNAFDDDDGNDDSGDDSVSG